MKTITCIPCLGRFPAAFHESGSRRITYATSLLASHASTLKSRPQPLTLQQRRHMTVDQLDSNKDDRERVVILGSGWGGYMVARQLDARKYQAVIVSPRSYFAFTPLLASTSVGTLEFRTALEPLRSKRIKVKYLQGFADQIDFSNKTVTIEESVDDPSVTLAPEKGQHAGERREQRPQERIEQAKTGRLFNLTYDKLVIAVGCYSQTFGTPGVSDHAFFLKDVGDARRIRNRILACFEAAALPTTSDKMRRQLLNFAVIGGGPTGIEFSAELHDIINEDLARIYPELIPFHKITVYDVADKVLPMFDEKLANYAMDTFKREGIAIKTRHHVEELRPGAPGEKVDSKSNDHACYTLKVKEEGEIGVGMVVWSTGLMQNPFVAKTLAKELDPSQGRLGLTRLGSDSDGALPKSWHIKRDCKSGSFLTDDRLQLKVQASGEGEKRPEATLQGVYVLGDCAVTEGSRYPATAQVASQKAIWLAKRLNKGDLEQSTFTWKNLGVMAYIGNWKALLQGGEGGGISGRTAWLVWRGAYLTKSVSVRNKILIPIYWFINWIFGRDISRF
ncbi:FAD/NAD(P)-binding domain-containing protein [Aaosphaeria arxii CBS 175.79]|uniref:FAD/NAD(P)-binding domain-containing protein n=1 Tax=Aaosphaeria arxii CBS 175.79 TaxID=1450172 RepID=A0A6A5XHP7_9PLEO|nr:FAD/NAD(P)-binding domain-containing protein [Aaosphaeria arxii CBS 175.79]KAF2012376.1 FAD/NAD(P)-binding domain-containing protein [Aaosphaeria arxii CBS 175.79]